MSTHAAPALLTTAQVAEALGCSVQTIRRAVADGSLEPVRLRPGSPFRFRLADVERPVYSPRPRPEELSWH